MIVSFLGFATLKQYNKEELRPAGSVYDPANLREDYKGRAVVFAKPDTRKRLHSIPNDWQCQMLRGSSSLSDY